MLWVFLLPLWHLKRLLSEGAGLSDQSRFAGVAEALPWPRWAPGTGSPGSLSFFGLDFIDPMFTVSVWASKAAQPGLFAAGFIGFALVLVLGRFFCGWACPYLPLLSVSQATRRLLSTLGFPLLDVRLPRWLAYLVLGAVLLMSSLVGVQLGALVYPPSVIGREVFVMLCFGTFTTASAGVVLAFFFDTFVSRAGFCRSVCPGGAMFSLLATASPLKVVNDRAKCTDCTACDVICNLGQRPMTNQLDAGCERCGRCIAVCPTQALAWRLARPAVARDEKGGA